MSWPYVVQQAINAAQASAFYALLAAAYVLLHGVVNRINLAFGAIAMWGAFLTIAAVAALSPGSAIPPMVVGVAALAAVAGTGALGLAAVRGIVLPLAGRSSLAFLIATIGLAIVLEEAVRLATGSRDRWLRPILADPLATFGPADFTIRITLVQAAVVATALAIALGLAVFVRRHRFGRIWRAAAEDPGMLALLGHGLRPVAAWTTVAASACAAAAGVLMAVYYGSVSFGMGAVLGLKALFVAVIGGLDSVGGALAGAVLLAAFEVAWSATMPTAWRDVASFLALTALLILRPDGLFARRDRADHRR